MQKPTYQELTKDKIPSAFPEGADGPSEIVVISGQSHGVESPVRHLGGCWYLDLKLKKKDATIFQEIRKSILITILYNLVADYSRSPAAGWTAFLYSKYEARWAGKVGTNLHQI